jgi:hypothetical protein
MRNGKFSTMHNCANWVKKVARLHINPTPVTAGAEKVLALSVVFLY